MVSVSPVALAAGLAEEIISQKDMTFTSLELSGMRLADGIDAIELPEKGLCLDLDQFVRALEFQIRFSPEDDVARGWFLDETRLFHLDLKAQRVTVGGIARSYPTDSIRKTELGVCVTTDVLQDWFPVNLGYEPQGALVGVVSREPLPIEVRLEREERKRSLQDSLETEDAAPPVEGKEIDYSWLHLPNIDIFGRAEHAKGDTGQHRTSVTYSAIAVGEVAKMTAETLVQSDTSAIPNSLRMRLYRRDPAGGVFGVPALTDVTVGDVNSLSNSLLNISAPGRGISISSYPLNLSDEYDRTTLRGDMPQGWQAELYRNDALVAYQDDNPNGRYEFNDVAVFFGINEFRVVLYGPQGQRREERRIVNTGAAGTPPGRLLARAVVQQDFRELIKIRNQSSVVAPAAPIRIQAEARYGLTNNLALFGSLSSFETLGQRETNGSLGAQTSIGRTALDIEGIANTQGRWAGQLSASRSFGATGVQLRHALFSRGFGSQKVAAGVQSRSEVSLTTALPGFGGTRTPLSVRATLDRQYDGSSQFNMSQQASLSFGNNNLVQNLNLSRALGASNATYASGNTLFSRRLQQSGVRAFASYDLSPVTRLRAIGVGYDRYIGSGLKRWYWNGTADWQVPEKVGNFSLSGSKEFDRFSLSLESAISTRKSWSIGASVSFSLSRDPVRGSWTMDAQESAQSGNVIARIFEDMNNDGIFSDGDIPLRNAEIISNEKNQKADEDGRIFLRGLASHTVTQLRAQAPEDYSVDLIQAKDSNVVARAGTTNSIDIPMIVSGSIEGQIDFFRDGASRPLRGIMVKLIGDKQTIVQYSEYDGYYLFQDIPTGAYRIELDGTQIEQMRLAGNLMRTTEVSRSRPYPAGINFKLSVASRAPEVRIAKTETPGGTRIAANGLFSDALAGSMAPTVQLALRRPLFDDRIALGSQTARIVADHKLTLTALFGDEVIDVPLAKPKPTATPPAHVTLTALFGDEVMNLPLAAPQPQAPQAPARKLPTPTIVVINPRFDETFATQSKRAVAVSAPIS
jgi:hypothetical protein